jgi:peptidoglycan/xylan/chitin deacetylase (PgdA/CDA1 family)
VTGSATTSLRSCRLGSAPGWPLVLYFHHVHPTLEHYTSLRAAAFAAGLDTVLDRFDPIGLDDVLGADGTIRRPDRPTVLITFDDGYADVREDALAILADRGVRATFFVCTGLLGQRSPEPGSDHLSWGDCAELQRAGHTVASHGVTHRRIDTLGPDEAAGEVRDSLTALRERLGVARAAYAYPYGFTAEIPGEIGGFTGAVTGFGTVKAGPEPWTDQRSAIRRTYLPTGEEPTWREIVAGWRRGWDGAA